MLGCQITITHAYSDENYYKALGRNILNIGATDLCDLRLQDNEPFIKDTLGRRTDEEADSGEGRLLISPTGEMTTDYQLTNLTEKPLSYSGKDANGEETSLTLAPLGSISLNKHNVVKFGKYTLTFAVGELSFRVILSDTTLPVEHSLPGEVIVWHTGSQPFQPVLKIENCKHRISPIGYSSAKQDQSINFELLHPRASTPPEGNAQVTFRLEVPASSYENPDAFAMVRTIRIERFGEHQIRLKTHLKRSLLVEWQEKFLNEFDTLKHKIRRIWGN